MQPVTAGKACRQSRKLSALHPWSGSSHEHCSAPLCFPSQLNRRVPSTVGVALHSSVRLLCKHPEDTPSSVSQCCIAFFFIVVTTNPRRSSLWKEMSISVIVPGGYSPLWLGRQGCRSETLDIGSDI